MGERRRLTRRSAVPTFVAFDCYRIDMNVTASPGDTARSICALDGCDTPVVRSDRGGRPRLYCSDTHRAQARRQRLRGGGGAGTEDAPELATAATLLEEVLATVQRAAAPAPSRPDPVLAAERAQATAALLQAQQAAAEAAAQADGAERRLAAERAAWEVERAELLGARERDAALVEELQAALEGTKGALQEELLRHDADLASAEVRLRSVVAAEEARRLALAQDLDRCGADLGEATARATAAEARAQRAEADASEARRSAFVEGRRATEGEVRAEHAVERVAELTTTLRRARAEAAADRRRHETARRELERRMAGLVRVRPPARRSGR